MQRPLVMAVAALIGGIILALNVYLPLGLIIFSTGTVLVAGMMGYRRDWKATPWLVLSCFLALGMFWTAVALERNRSVLGDWMETHLELTGVVAEEPQVYQNRMVYVLLAREVRQEGRSRSLNEKVQITVYLPTSGDGAPGGPGEREPQPAGRVWQVEGVPAPDVLQGTKVYNYGDVLQVRGRLEPPPGRRNPGEFDYREYLARRGIFTRMLLSDSGAITRVASGAGNPLVRVALAAKAKVVLLVERSLPPDRAGVLLALLFGDKERLDERQAETFRELGLFHVFAVSGLHVGFLLFFLVEVAGLARLRKGTTAALVVAGLLFYTAVTGFTPSVVRAVLMAAVGTGAYLWQRERDFYSALALAALVLLLVNPLNLMDAGFQLSFLATLGLVYLFPLLDGLLGFLPYWRRYLLMPLAAQLSLLPLTAYYFNQVSLAALLANLVIVPLVGVAVVLGLVMFIPAIALPLVAILLVRSIGVVIRMVLAGTSLMNSLPGAVLPVRTPHLWEMLLYYGCLVAAREAWQHRKDPCWQALARRWSRKVAATIVAAMLLAVIILNIIPEKVGQLQVTFLDVGQGSSVYIRTPGGRHLLLDGGGRPQVKGAAFDVGEDIVVPYLVRGGVKRVDLLISSHPDADHLQGLSAVLNDLPVSLAVTPPPEYFRDGYREFIDLAKRRRVRLAALRRGDAIAIEPGLRLEVLAPAGSLTGTRSDDNNNSLVVRLTYGETSFLLTGDVEQEGMEEMLRSGAGMHGTILLIPHHGSRNGMHERFLTAVNPLAVVIQVGAKNSFGHPVPEVTDFWARRGVPVYRTDTHGAITFHSDGQSWWVETMIPVGELGRRIYAR